MPINRELRSRVLGLVRDAGYSVYVGSRYRPGSTHPSVCLSFNSESPSPHNFQTYCVGVDYELPEDERSALWLHHGPRIASLLADQGVPVDLEMFRTLRDGRTFAVRTA